MSGLSKTGIPYCTRTWSPVRGCAEDGECSASGTCWAKATCWRLARNPRVAKQFEGLVESEGDFPSEPAWSAPLRWTGLIREYPEEFDAPLRARKPQVVFVVPQGDIALAPPATITRLFEVMGEAEQHQFLVLTKRPVLLMEALYGKAGSWYFGGGDYIDNVHVGVSISRQAEAEKRLPVLLSTWAGPTWVSAEPCLGHLDLSAWLGPRPWKLNWVVAGSADTLAHGAARFTPSIARDLRDQCLAAGVALWIKQASWHLAVQDRTPGCPNRVEWRGELGWESESPRRAMEALMLDGRVWGGCPNEAIAAILRRDGKLP